MSTLAYACRILSGVLSPTFCMKMCSLNAWHWACVRLSPRLFPALNQRPEPETRCVGRVICCAGFKISPGSSTFVLRPCVTLDPILVCYSEQGLDHYHTFLHRQTTVKNNSRPPELVRSTILDLVGMCSRICMFMRTCMCINSDSSLDRSMINACCCVRRSGCVFSNACLLHVHTRFVERANV